MTGGAFFAKLGISAIVPAGTSEGVSLVLLQLQNIAGIPLTEAPPEELKPAPTISTILQGVAKFLQNVIGAGSASPGNSTFISNDLSGATSQPTFTPVTISSVLSDIANFLRSFLTPFGGQ
jgi:hypothetical protein